MLPDVALLEIFHFYVDEEEWYTLVHVCRIWRNVVFGSPRRLNLRLRCGARTPVRKTLDIWPLLPIEVRDGRNEASDMDNIFAALELHSRICEISLTYFDTAGLEKVLAAMQQPFPELTSLRLGFGHYTTLVQSDSFLGGSAPRLRSLTLLCIPFPGLPNLLLSATHLVDLRLWRILHSGYISPEAMVTGLSVLTRLERLEIQFESPRSRPTRKSRCSPPQTRSLLPVLTSMQFHGACKYLEDLVARIDAPLLNQLAISFFHKQFYDTLQLTQFIGRTLGMKTYVEARVVCTGCNVRITLPETSDGEIKLGISCGGDLQLPSLVQLSSFLQALICTVETLYIAKPILNWPDDIESSQWLELFRAFTAVKGLYISQEFVPHIAPALKGLVGDRVTEVLPALQTLCLEETLPSGPVQELIAQFVAARELAGHPIVVSSLGRKIYEYDYSD